MAEIKTLDDALNGLLNYWRARPNGGTRAELIAMATNQGFVEPVLNQWIDVFLGGFLRLNMISAATYPALATMVAAAGFDLAAERARNVYDHLLEGRALAPIQAANAAQILDNALAGFTTRLANIDAGIAFVLANVAPGAVRDDTLDAAQRGRKFWQTRLDSAISEKARFLALAAG